MILKIINLEITLQIQKKHQIIRCKINTRHKKHIKLNPCFVSSLPYYIITQ